MSRAAALLVLALAAAGCGSDPGPPGAVISSPAVVAAPNATRAPVAPVADAGERAKRAAGDFSGRLRAALTDRMQSAGPVAAVDFCHAQAPVIADAVMAKHGVRLGRVAVPGRNRNPGNAPMEWQVEALMRFQAVVDAGAEPGEQLLVQREDLPPGVALRMMRGIAVEPGCLACHGRAVAPAVSEAIGRRYPGDAASGFDVGDLRGGLWVEVPASP